MDQYWLSSCITGFCLVLMSMRLLECPSYRDTGIVSEKQGSGLTAKLLAINKINILINKVLYI